MDEKAICALGRRKLQALAKQHGIKANMKNAEIVSELLPLLSHAQPEPAQEPPAKGWPSASRRPRGLPSRASSKSEADTSLAAEETPENMTASRNRISSGAAAARRSGASRASVQAESFTSHAAEETPEPKSASRRSVVRPSRASFDQETSGLADKTRSGEERRSSSVAAASATLTPHTEGRVQMKSAGRKSSFAAAAVQETDAADARCSAKRSYSCTAPAGGSRRSTAEALEEPKLSESRRLGRLGSNERWSYA